MSCTHCGKSQGPKCEGGQVRYLDGLFPCAKLVGHATREPAPEREIPVPTGLEGLEDIL